MPDRTRCDVDGDGDVDFAHVGLETPELGWRINEGAGSTWTLRTVPAPRASSEAR